MAARLKDIAITRNAGWSLTLFLFQDKARKVPMPLAGYTVKSDLRAGESSSTALLSAITCEIVAPDTGGAVRLSLSQVQIAAIAAADGWFDVLLCPAAGMPKRMCYAHVVIGDGETQWP
jgi:hypothetical protein